jgi:hypothetical protein
LSLLARHTTQTARYGVIIVFVSESWTDERLNDLRDSVVEFRGETHREFLALRKEMKDEFAAVRKEMRDEFAAVRQEMKDGFAALRKEMRDEFAAVRQEMKDGFEGIQRLMIQFMGLMIAALIGLIATTQL